jgi:hypothetical protein
LTASVPETSPERMTHRGTPSPPGSRGLAWAIAGLVATGCSSSPAALVANPTDVDFGAVPYGETVTKQVTLTSHSSESLLVTYLLPGVVDLTDDAGQYLFDSDGWLGGLPATLAPKANLTLTLQWTAHGGPLSQTLEIFYGSAASELVSVTVHGTSAGVAPVCVPPGQENSATGTSTSALYTLDFNQNGWSCGAITPGDAGLGVACQTSTDCPAFCCMCPRDCAGVAIDACVNGTCAPEAVACDMGFAIDPGEPCPDGGLPDNSLLGAYAFTVNSTEAHFDGSTGALTVTLSDQATGGSGTLCDPLDGGERLELALMGGLTTDHVDAGLFPTLDLGGTAKVFLYEADGGKVGLSGYVYLSDVTQYEVGGSFDLIGLDKLPASEITGSFDATICR